MRLVCPNCEAKYEVPDDAIPDGGRDVQCASCGHAWYQMRPRAASAVTAADDEAVADVGLESRGDAEAPMVPEMHADASDDLDLTVSERTDVEPDPAPESVLAPLADTGAAEPTSPSQTIDEVVAADVEPELPVPEVAAGDTAVVPDLMEEAGSEPEPEVASLADAPDESADVAADDDETGVPEAQGAAAYAVDESVLAILREEAEREANARRAEAAPLEIQPELGIEAALSPGPAAGADESEDTSATARRIPFPDVEEINSTLRPEEHPVEEFEAVETLPPPPEPRRGFRSGFLTMMSLAILAAALYIAAPSLGSMIPALEGPLARYVGAVDGLRMGLDGMMRSATLAINGN